MKKFIILFFYLYLLSCNNNSDLMLVNNTKWDQILKQKNTICIYYIVSPNKNAKSYLLNVIKNDLNLSNQEMIIKMKSMINGIEIKGFKDSLLSICIISESNPNITIFHVTNEKITLNDKDNTKVEFEYILK